MPRSQRGLGNRIIVGVLLLEIKIFLFILLDRQLYVDSRGNFLTTLDGKKSCTTWDAWNLVNNGINYPTSTADRRIFETINGSREMNSRKKLHLRSSTFSPLKNHGWKTILSYWEGNVSGDMSNFQGAKQMASSPWDTYCTMLTPESQRRLDDEYRSSKSLKGAVRNSTCCKVDVFQSL